MKYLTVVELSHLVFDAKKGKTDYRAIRRLLSELRDAPFNRTAFAAGFEAGRNSKHRSVDSAYKAYVKQRRTPRTHEKEIVIDLEPATRTF